MNQPAEMPRDDAFDRRLRLHYWQATSQLSARTRAQLQQRLRAATAPSVASMRTRRAGWSLAAACSLALVFGVVQHRQGLEHAPRFAATADTSDNNELVATLDETPDLYLWVASDDAAAMSSE